MFLFKKKWIQKMFMGCVLTSFAGLFLTGCGGAPKNAGDIKSEIHVAVHAQPESYDLDRTTAIVARDIMLGNVFEMLVSFDRDYKIQPELAEKFEVNSDYTEYTYFLRKGVKFHNGQEMKADDVVASMNRWLNDTAAKNIMGDARFTKVDDYTVKIHLNNPCTVLNDMICSMIPSPIIVPKAVIDAVDPKTRMIQEYIGTGPYKVDSIKQDDYVKLVKNDAYKPYGEVGKSSGWNGYKEAKTPIIYFNFVKDPSTRVSGIKSGEYDIALQLPLDSYSEFKGKNDFTIFKEAGGNIILSYNKKQGISTNPKLRQAVNAALNSAEIMKAAMVEPEFYKLNSSYMMNEKSKWYTDIGKTWYNQHDAGKAKALLVQAGYQGEPFRILVTSSYQEYYNAAIVIEQELKEIGINAQLSVVDWGTFLTTRKDASQYDAFITGTTVPAVPNQILYLSPVWDGWATDSHVQTELKDITATVDTKEAVTKWQQLQKYCWEEYVPASPLGDYFRLNVGTSKVKGMDWFEGPHMWNVTVSE